MGRALYLKFSQNQELKEKLLSTEDKILIEKSDTDSYWGGTIEGSANKLGILLMETRSTLR